MLVWAGWRLLGHIPYRIDIDVYRMGGRAWLDGTPLYADGAMFHTRAGLDLPFTYPPLAAIVFAPFAWLPLPAASVAITVITLVLLLICRRWIVLTRLDGVAQIVDHPRAGVAAARLAGGRASWRLRVIYLEPIRRELRLRPDQRRADDAGDRRLRAAPTPWPRGMLLGLAIALKLTPAVFLLYFVLRRDDPRAARHRGVGGRGHAGGLRPRLARLVGVLDRHRAQHRPDRHRDAEHQPEHRRRAGPARPRRGRAVRAVDAGLLRGAGGDDLGGAAGAARRRTGARADLRGHVRAGGVTGVVVAPLGLGAADGDRVQRGRLPAPACAALVRSPRRGGADGVDARST